MNEVKQNQETTDGGAESRTVDALVRCPICLRLNIMSEYEENHPYIQGWQRMCVTCAKFRLNDPHYKWRMRKIQTSNASGERRGIPRTLHPIVGGCHQPGLKTEQRRLKNEAD